MKDAKGHGSNGKGGGMPIPGHDYHTKTDAQLRYIAKDASDAAKATRGMSMYDPNSHQRQDTEGKYLDQMNNAASVLGYRARGGAQVVKDIAAQHGIPTGHLKTVGDFEQGKPGFAAKRLSLVEPRAIGINRPWRE